MPYSPSEAKAKAAAYYQANKEKKKAQARDYYNAHREDRLSQVKSHYETNREQIVAYKADHRARPENREKERIRSAKRYQDDPKYRARMRSRTRARQYNIRNTELTAQQREEITSIYQEAERLTAETGIPHEVDHIHPLSKGGSHTPENLQVLTQFENRSKGAKAA